MFILKKKKTAVAEKSLAVYVGPPPIQTSVCLVKLNASLDLQSKTPAGKANLSIKKFNLFGEELHKYDACITTINTIIYMF